jgi:NADH:ubiquinone oxidoreductase subunit F (NADH-binding)
MSEMMEASDKTSTSIDSLSSIGRQLLKLDAATAYDRLVIDSSGNPAAKMMLESLSPRDLIEGPIISAEDADAVMAGLWLRHDWLNESHKISRRIDNATGSFWHAIMHRREGDFSNSKYWYHKAGEYPLFKTLAVRASEVINPFPADKSVFRITNGVWNSAAFVDLVEQVHDQPRDPRHGIAIALQQLEWNTLFQHCTRAASGR